MLSKHREAVQKHNFEQETRNMQRSRHELTHRTVERQRNSRREVAKRSSMNNGTSKATLLHDILGEEEKKPPLGKRSINLPISGKIQVKAANHRSTDFKF